MRSAPRDSKASIVLVDDETLLRELLAEYIKQDDSLEVVGDFGDGAAALVAIAECQPDLVLLDLRMPGMHGEVLQAEISRLPHPPKILVLSSDPSPASVRTLLGRGVRGILQKGISAREVLSGIKTVLNGGIALQLSDAVATDQLFENFEHAGVPLSRRETQIAQLVAEGATSKTIAEKLGVSSRTVDKHRENLMRKLGVKDSSGVVRHAVAMGLASTPTVPIS